jgi:hypothetical protein
MFEYMNVMSVSGEDSKSISEMIRRVLDPRAPSSYKLSRLIKSICTWMQINPNDLSLFLPHIKQLSTAHGLTTARLMLILSQINHSLAADMLISVNSFCVLLFL